MLKFLAILFVGFWILRSVFKFFFNPFIQGASQKQGPQQTRQHTRPKDGNVDVNYAPKKGGKNKSTENFNGGDYVDYEEVD